MKTQSSRMEFSKYRRMRAAFLAAAGGGAVIDSRPAGDGVAA